jgi:hypothetical protein
MTPDRALNETHHLPQRPQGRPNKHDADVTTAARSKSPDSAFGLVAQASRAVTPLFTFALEPAAPASETSAPVRGRTEERVTIQQARRASDYKVTGCRPKAAPKKIHRLEACATEEHPTQYSLNYSVQELSSLNSPQPLGLAQVHFARLSPYIPPQFLLFPGIASQLPVITRYFPFGSRIIPANPG